MALDQSLLMAACPPLFALPVHVWNEQPDYVNAYFNGITDAIRMLQGISSERVRFANFSFGNLTQLFELEARV